MHNLSPNYVLVSPARNEEAYIEKTIQSVIDQTVLPLKYVIVSDGSTDKTDEIVKSYAGQHPFIELVRRIPDGVRNFGSKVYAVREGVARLKDIEYDFIGIMDADMSFGPDVMEKVLQKQLQHPKIGICGGLVWEFVNGKWSPYKTEVNWSVSGAMQMFRRECYESFGGYIPLKRGGIEMVVEVMARMHGWQVRTLEEIRLDHLRAMGSVKYGVLKGRFKRGQMEYVNGYHPLFQFFRFFKQISKPPFLFDTSSRTAGYFWSMITMEPHSVPKDVISYMRKEQLTRLAERIFSVTPFSFFKKKSSVNE